MFVSEVLLSANLLAGSTGAYYSLLEVVRFVGRSVCLFFFGIWCQWLRGPKRGIKRADTEVGRQDCTPPRPTPS